MLSDSEIRKEMVWDTQSEQGLLVDPAPEDVQYQPASLDLRLGNVFKTFVVPLNARFAKPLNPREIIPEEYMHTETLQEVAGAESGYILMPEVFTLAMTKEYVGMPRHLVGQVEGRSSIGRLGVIVHFTAGLIDPGFSGNITLEMINLSPRPVILYVGMRICQLVFERIDGEVLRPYGHRDLCSKYMGQTITTSSRAHKDIK